MLKLVWFCFGVFLMQAKMWAVTKHQKGCNWFGAYGKTLCQGKEGKNFRLLEEKEMRRPKQFNQLSVKCIRRVGGLHSWMLCCHCQTLPCWLPILELWERSRSSAPCQSLPQPRAVGTRAYWPSPAQTQRGRMRVCRHFEIKGKKLLKYFETEMQAIYTLFRYGWHSHLENAHL